jgi:AcrR family transcriptional regulator
MAARRATADSKQGTRLRAPKQERSLATVNAIEQAIDELVERYGVEHVTARAVAARSGVGPATLYRYFRTRDAMIASWELRRLQREGAAIFAIVAEAQRDSWPLARAVRTVSERGALLLIDYVARRGGRELFSTLRERAAMAEPALEILTSAIAQALDLRRSISDVPLASRVAFYAVTMTSLAAAIGNPGPEESAAFAREIGELAARYLVAPAHFEDARGAG